MRNRKVWIAALCCDVPHSFIAFGSYTFSLLNAYNMLNSTGRHFLGTDIEMKLNPFKTGAVKLFGANPPSHKVYSLRWFDA